MKADKPCIGIDVGPNGCHLVYKSCGLGKPWHIGGDCNHQRNDGGWIESVLVPIGSIFAEQTIEVIILSSEAGVVGNQDASNGPSKAEYPISQVKIYPPLEAISFPA